MGIKSRLLLLVLTLFIAFSFSLNAQEEVGAKPLVEIFKVLEQQYSVQFNYAEDRVEGILIKPPSLELSLKKALEYIEELTGLSFFIVSDNFILVNANNKTLFFKLQSLPEVVISSYLVKGINKLNDGSFQVDFSNFDILPGLIDTDVLQTIQAFPGILSSNETVSNINIRGGTHDQNLILWDDIKMYQSGHFFGLISMYNPQITQEVSLIKNGTETSFTDGVSGTISMKTEQKINKEFKGSFGANFIDVNGFVDVPVNENSSLQFAARKSISDVLETPTYSNLFDRISQDTEVETNVNSIINSDKTFDFYDVSLRWIYKINDKDKLQLNFINVDNELMFNENAMVNSVEESRQSNLTQNSIAGGINYNRIWNNKWQSSLEIYETDYKLKAINANIIDNQRFLQENVVSETSLKLKANYKLNNKLQLRNGYHFVETKVTNLNDVDVPVFRQLVSEVVRTHALFSQLKFKSLNRKTNFNFGLRYNYIDKFRKHLLEPRLSFNYKISDAFTFEALGEMKHQNTSQIINFQNDFLGIEKRRWQLSNDNDIPVLLSKQISVGINYTSKGWLVSTESYFKTIDGITTQSQGFQNQYEFIRTSGSYDVFGLDVLLRKHIKNFNAWLSYSYMNNDYTFNSLPENSFPSNYDITHAITFGTAYVSSRFKVSSGLNWHSGKPTTNPSNGHEIVDNEINFEATNTSKLKSYLRLDVSALYNFKLGKKANANLGISIWNVLDRSNEVNNFFRINDDAINEVRQSSLGITPNAFFRVNF
ncbi:TonB-dependent receptor plug domain-containing protein [Ichthyenterobacterium magnum]|uniref:TonB-dependent receptor-like protein n=1 Tax=Ichthyenterobacterium magnum TaxID=1230530 RepID=A0A420DLB7_9FLAO|nr:TonB-dependent receptor plug domain-containing protein [Ichthyenterobacterium magnum]RKE94991.1 TonB-dependent receptor-like protein [Ichthyenterobacterium magnum]